MGKALIILYVSADVELQCLGSKVYIHPQSVSLKLISKTPLLNIFLDCHVPVADQETDTTETLSNTAPTPTHTSDVPTEILTVVGVLPAEPSMADELHRSNPVVQSLLDLPTTCTQVSFIGVFGGALACELLLW